MSKRYGPSKKECRLPIDGWRLWVCVGCGQSKFLIKKVNPNNVAGYKCWKCEGTKWV